VNDRQARFVEEYIVDFNATQAAIRAGYSQSTARQQASRLLTNVDISQAISERLMSADEVVARLSDIARGDIKDLMRISSMGYELELLSKDDEGNFRVNPHTKLIKKIKQKVTTIMPRNEDGEEKEIVETDLELYSALDALALLGRHHKLFTDKTEITGKDGGAIEVDDARESIQRKLAGISTASDEG
jgi:phage terminase small subunit